MAGPPEVLLYLNSENPKRFTQRSNEAENDSLLKFASLPKGIHITAMGSDAEEKNELDPEIIKNCDIYVPDNQAQTTILGELNHAIKKNLIKKETLFYDLGKIILNPELGRKSNNDITVADLTGTGAQDTAIARYTYSIAKNKNLGMNVE